MGWSKISWAKIRGIFGLKAIALAFIVTPATVAAPPLATPAAAQFGINIPIPGIQFYGGGYGGRRYGRGSGRHNRGSGRRHGRGGGGGGGGSEASARPPGKGVRGNSD